MVNMTQYHDPDSRENTAVPKPRPDAAAPNLRAEIRRMRETMEDQAREILDLRRDVRRMRDQINQHAQTINRINRG